MQSSIEISPVDDEPINRHPYYIYAQEAIDAVSKRFPRGAINQINNAKNQQCSSHEIFNLLNLFAEFRDTLEQNAEDMTPESLANLLAHKVKHSQFGHCGIFSAYAVGFLKHTYDSTLFELSIESVSLDVHQLLVIGRNKNSDPKDISTWGNALMCDPWSNEIYHCKKFCFEQQKTIVLPFYGIYRSCRQIGPVYTPYLTGNPEADDSYDEIFKAWYIKDSKVQLYKRKPSLSFIGARGLNSNYPNEALNYFSQITGISGWKFSPRNIGRIWAICPDEINVRFIANHLKQLDFITHIHIKRNPKTDQIALLCDDVDFFKLRKLANTQVKIPQKESMLRQINRHSIS